MCVQLPSAWADDSLTNVKEADLAIQSAFAEVLAVEKAGGKVSWLLVELNDAAALLVEAENAYLAGDLNTAVANADQARSIAQQVQSNASSLSDGQLVKSQFAFWLTLAGSIVGVVAFSMILLLAWKRFSRSYLKKMSNLRTEVVND